ncbi:histidine phosphatase family protein [Pseudomonas sp. NPDC087814]|uniref:histidine phosphatase family protein n=1 Tax=Pseudomonas sp. NPDC087814 TaxID=3364450 RepID=UPI0037FEE425
MILYIRHGQTDYNINNLWMGSIDTPLNDEGRAQAKNAAIELSKIHLKKIYSSPLIRAYETAQIIAKQQCITPEISILPGIQERCFGELEGTYKSLNARANINFYSSVENKDLFKRRIMSSINSINKHENILIVSHSAVFRCLIEELGYLTVPPSKNIKNCQIVKLKTPTSEIVTQIEESAF